jgi:hypothetical protein
MTIPILPTAGVPARNPNAWSPYPFIPQINRLGRTPDHQPDVRWRSKRLFSAGALKETRNKTASPSRGASACAARAAREKGESEVISLYPENPPNPPLTKGGFVPSEIFWGPVAREGHSPAAQVLCGRAEDVWMVDQAGPSCIDLQNRTRCSQTRREWPDE